MNPNAPPDLTHLDQLASVLGQVCSEVTRCVGVAGVDPDCEVVRRLCQHWPDTFTVSSADLLLDRIEQDIPEALLLYQTLDDAPGIAVLEMLRRAYPQLPILFVATNGSEQLAIRAWKMSADAYLMLPLDPSTICETTKTAIAKRKREIELSEYIDTARAQSPFAVLDIYLISFDGRLLLHHRNRASTAIDEDVLGGMLTVLESFIEDSFKTTPGQLQAIDYRSIKLLFEAGSTFYLVVIGEGDLIEPVRKRMAEVRRRIEERYCERIKNWSGDMTHFRELETELSPLVES